MVGAGQHDSPRRGHPVADLDGQLTLTIAPGGDVDAAELAGLTRQLRRELLATDASAIEVAASGEPPPGAKAIDALSWGTLLVTFVRAGVLGQVVGVVQAWLGRHDQGSITLAIGGDSITVSRATGEEKRQLIDEWLKAHGGG
jgi:hypothetical protein